ncbi:MAG: septal ring lytic transglycosylase RlpA family protein [Alphaproteobacteria bacterium]
MTAKFTHHTIAIRLICASLTVLTLSSCGLIGRRSVNQPIEDLPPPSANFPVAPAPTASFSNTGQSQTLDANRTLVLNNLLRQGPVGPYTVGTAYTIGGQRYVPRENLSYIEQGLASWYGPGLSGNPTSSGERFNPNAHTAAHRTLPFSSIVRVTNLTNGRSTLVRINDRGPFLANHIIDLSQRAAQDLALVTSQGGQVRVELMEAETRAVAKATGRSVGFNSSTSLTDSTPFVSTPTFSNTPTTIAPATPLLPTVNSSSTVTVAPIQAPTSIPVPAPTPAFQNTTSSNAVPLPPLPTPSTPTVTNTANLSTAAGAASGFYVQAGSYSSRENAEQVRNKLTSVGNVVIFPVMVAGSQRFRVRVGPFSTRQQAQAKLGTVIVSGGPDAIVVKEG